MKIGIFDTGLGGEMVAAGLRQLLPEHEYLVVNDRENLPYGDKPGDKITHLTDLAIRPLLEETDIIIIACNTATAAAIETLRSKYLHVYFVGFEPMFKPAAQLTNTRKITVLATSSTRGSERYKLLKEAHANGLQVYEPDTRDWASLIEQGSSEQINLSEVDQSVIEGSDVIVLACTHYLALKAKFETKYPHAKVIEPLHPIANQVAKLTTIAEQLQP